MDVPLPRYRDHRPARLGVARKAEANGVNARLTNEKRHRDLPSAGRPVRDCDGTQPAVPVARQSAEHRTIDWRIRHLQPGAWTAPHYRRHGLLSWMVVRPDRSVLEHVVDLMAPA